MKPQVMIRFDSEGARVFIWGNLGGLLDYGWRGSNVPVAAKDAWRSACNLSHCYKPVAERPLR